MSADTGGRNMQSKKRLDWTNKTAVVAGNGPSLGSLIPGSVTDQDLLIRCNSFFFEQEYYLGNKIDLYYAGGDPRVAPFMLATLRREIRLGNYQVMNWTSHDYRISDRQSHHLKEVPFLPYSGDRIEQSSEFKALLARYDRVPTSGVRAVLALCGVGVRHIILAGMDQYTQSQNYYYTPGRKYSALMGRQSSVARPDDHLHNMDLDRSILNLIATRGVTLEVASPQSPLCAQFDLAKVRKGRAVKPRPKVQAPDDWVSWAGPYPIQLLSVLRAARRLQRKLSIGFRDNK